MIWISGCYKLCERCRAWYVVITHTGYKEVIIMKPIITNSYYDGLHKPDLNYFRKSY